MTIEDICCENVIRVTHNFHGFIFPFFKKSYIISVFPCHLFSLLSPAVNLSLVQKKKKFHDLLGLFHVFLILYIAKVVNIDNLRDLSLVHVPDRS